MQSLITVTPAALQQLRAALAQADEPDLGLRAAARITEDGGIEYGMGLDEPREQDERIEVDDVVTLLVSPPSRDMLAGTFIDYVEVAPGEMRFVFYRPAPEPEAAPAGEETRRCGCGAGGCGGSG
jgi:iron-sulfur cluster assembly protein